MLYLPSNNYAMVVKLAEPKAGITDPGLTGGWGTGPLLTPSLLFLAQDDDGKFLLRAFDKTSGATIAELELPASPSGTPMTYSVGGRQYIALATGSGKNAGLVALTLPVR